MIMTREWAMPNKNTFSIKPIEILINKYIHGTSIDPFANESRIASITNDLDTKYNTTYNLDAIDFLKMFGNDSVDTVLYDPPYCYDKETELMTQNGWKFFDELTYDDLIATLNTETNMLEYHKPIEIIKKKYSGDMISFESQSVSLLVTPNHKMWTKHSYYKDYMFEDAIDVVGKNTWFKKSCEYYNNELDYFTLPEVSLLRNNIHGERHKPSKDIPMDTWLKFLGLYLSEGCCKNNDYLVCITQKKEHNLSIIEDVLNDFGYKYNRDKYDYKIYDKQLWSYLKLLGKSQDKYIPYEFKSLSKRQLNILLKYLMIGDGTNITYPKFNVKANKMYHYTTNSYYTSSKRLMNDVSEICIKCGYGITVTEKRKQNYNVVYNIHMLKAKDFKVSKNNISIEQNFNDYIYCVTVPNSTVLVKRKGRCVWSGNSPRQVSECYKSLGKTVNMETTQSSFWGNMKKEIARITKPSGIVISFGWNSGGIGKTLGFEIIEILLVAHGGNHNDTIVTVERKISDDVISTNDFPFMEF